MFIEPKFKTHIIFCQKIESAFTESRERGRVQGVEVSQGCRRFQTREQDLCCSKTLSDSSEKAAIRTDSTGGGLRQARGFPEGTGLLRPTACRLVFCLVFDYQIDKYEIIMKQLLLICVLRF